MKVGDANARGQDGIVWMLSGKRCGGLGRELVQFRRGDAGVHALNDLLRNNDGVYMLRGCLGVSEQ